MSEPKAPVPAAPAAPPRYGLVVSARTPNTDGNRWEIGFSFAPEGCGTATAVDRCLPGSLDIGDNVDIVDHVPVALWAGDKCAPWEVVRDWQGRARRQLLAAGPTQLAAEFWTGDVATAKGYPNTFLASPDAETLTDGPASALNGLACLEQGIAERGHGARGMIHATPSAVTYWQTGGALRREGALLLTQLDTIVVADAGYDGSGPAGQAAISGSVWAYGTTMVDVRLGEIVIVPDADPSGLASVSARALDRSGNTVEYFAWRMGAATWDGCAHVAVELDIAGCGIGGS